MFLMAAPKFRRLDGSSGSAIEESAKHLGKKWEQASLDTATAEPPQQFETARRFSQQRKSQAEQSPRFATLSKRVSSYHFDSTAIGRTFRRSPFRCHGRIARCV